MGTHAGSVLTLANSIIGVSVLAMPFCFKQCGIILSIVMLILSNVVTRLACYYLIKSAIMEKRKNFEMLAFRVLGRSGKLIVELCIIGFMLGTCVAFFVVVGDLGPTILGEVMGVEHPSALRPSILIGLGVFVVLPLGLLRNVESLSTLCAASIAFYVCLVLKVMGEAGSHLVAGDWMDKVSFWRPAGVLQCIPIFSMALSCQTQLFEVFDSLPSTPMERMNSIIRSAINMTTTFYIAVGFFGYVAFCNQPFTGNLLINLSPSTVSYIIKLGFVLSVAVSFPLVIFPCRASIYSLVFTTGSLTGVESSQHIPETKFQCITLLIVTLSLVTGLLVPSIEAVLGFVGSTIGFFVCIILPSVIFVCLSKKNTSERLLAKVLACMGLITMVLSTYANLTAVENSPPGNFPPPDLAVLPVIHKQLPVQEQVQLGENVEKPQLPKQLDVKQHVMNKLKSVEELKELVLPELKQIEQAKNKRKFDSDIQEKKEDKSRQEPPNPVPEEPKVPPKRKKTVLVPPLIKNGDDDRLKPKIDIEDIKKSMEKLDLPKSATVEKAEEKNLNLIKEEIIRINDTINIKKASDQENGSIPKVKGNDEIIKKSSLAESIANGVPLPLAIKGKLDSKKTIGADIKEREKRDALVESEAAGLERNYTDDSEAVVQNSTSRVTGEKENGKSFVKEIEKDKIIDLDGEQCLKNTTQVESPSRLDGELINSNSVALPINKNSAKLVSINANAEPSVDENRLIKTPSYLSDPNLILDSKKMLDVAEPNVDAVPLKRDLKSVAEPLETNKVQVRHR